MNCKSRLLLITILGFSLSSHASAPLEREVSVTGSCSREIPTDRGAVVVTADVQDDNLKAAVKKATAQYDRAVEGIKRLRLENFELRTVEYDVSEVREWVKNQSVSKGFRARIGLRVSTSDVQRLGEVTEIAARDEIRSVGALTSYLSDERIRKEQDLCLKEAAENAREKATRLATTLGASLGPVITLTENGAPRQQSPIRPIMRRTMVASSAATETETPDIQNGTQEVSATIQAEFELKPGSASSKD